jgi:hypothetical protein
MEDTKMPMDRKDLLVAADDGGPAIPELKLAKTVDEGGAYISLKNNLGWKRLIAEYIEPKLKLDALLSVSNEDLPLVRAKMQVLKELVDFVDKKVDGAVKAFETLQRNREDKNV